MPGLGTSVMDDWDYVQLALVSGTMMRDRLAKQYENLLWAIERLDMVHSLKESNPWWYIRYTNRARGRE